ncbi:MAG: Asp-tRNA(Asn)/Glu-tRNA(Gln) amidotransferase subunit GatB [Candidatus Omnitrophota bacterium]|nr:MAG: Asp-tRNA(Asn)/Glu-tRNA(Gln) amidotransferase subunit GatB [Candidatus Omnitrophota bacterium]
MNKYDIVIGLEVHVQLKTDSKIFCSCSTQFEAPPNTNICPVCCGYPGVLPVFNQKALDLGVRVGLALNCQMNEKIYFERKNYFYPDLPKNYQISQYKMPLGENGKLQLPGGKKIGIKRVHLEEDAGKLIHSINHSLVDLNRTGIPLLEIVSEPDIESAQEAFDYLTQLKLILQYIGASECEMEKGLLRCDANISLKPKQAKELGVKVELKNMNSFRGVRDALSYEAKRQEKALEENERIVQETRLWDEAEQISVSMRSKEEAHDYRYFPEPDLLDFKVSKDCIESQKDFVGELPLKKRKRFLESYGLSEKEVDIIISNLSIADFFEESCKEFNEPKKIANWILGPFLEQVNSLADKLNEVKITAPNFAKIVKLFCEGKLNNLTAKRVLSLALTTNRDIDEIIEKEGLVQVSSEDELGCFAKEVIKENPKPVGQYKEGKEQAIMFLVGQMMKKTKGKANPKIARQILEKILKESG